STGGSYGIVAGVAGLSTVTNTGVITARWAIYGADGSGHMDVTNSGTLTGDVVLNSNPGNELHNSGFIDGDVTFNGGSNQVYDGVGGTLSGSITFGSLWVTTGVAGADYAYLGNEGEFVQG